MVYKDMTFREAMKQEDAEKWIEGVIKEFDSLVKLNAFVEAALPKGREPIGCHWIMHRKTDRRHRPQTSTH